MPSKRYRVGGLMALVGIISFILIIPKPSGYAKSDDSLLTPASPVPTLYFPNPAVPELLFACPDEIVTGPGPTWHGITIGVSTIQDLDAVFGKPNKITLIKNTPVSDYIIYGDTLGGCVQNGILVTLLRGRELPRLSDFIAIYGPLDAVTWTPSYNTRVVFWFKEGVAVEVLTATIDRTAPSWGRVLRTFYFPYQPVEGYEQRWPYNATQREMPSLVGIGDPVPTEQNPFDFGAMVATITAQPSRTPTPTFAPQPTRAATPVQWFQQPLPNDLVFTGRDSSNWDMPPTLALVNSTTLEVVPFYTDEKAIDLKALSWSPQGDLLAVLFILPALEGTSGYPTEICILTTSGESKACFQDRPPAFYAEAPFLIHYEYTVTWSTDGRKVYFMAEDAERKTRRLIEADVETGKTLRTIFETDSYDAEWVPTIISWTPQLDYVAVGIGLIERTGFLVNLHTNETLDLSRIVKSWAGGLAQDQPLNTGLVCTGFSPNGTYLTAIDTYDDRIIIFDKELNIVQELDNPADNSVLARCPTWDAHENTLYFLVSGNVEGQNHLFTYSIEDSRVIAEVDAPVYAPFVFSPDFTHIAFTELNAGEGTYQIKIRYPDGEIYQLASSFRRAEYPLWRPGK